MSIPRNSKTAYSITSTIKTASSPLCALQELSWRGNLPGTLVNRVLGMLQKEQTLVMGKRKGSLSEWLRAGG